MKLPEEGANITQTGSADTVVNFHRHKPAPQKRVVLLQGPVGPFFNKLQKFLITRSYDAWRICFHPGDLAFSNPQNRIYFQHGLTDWESWFSDFVAAGNIEHIILFGAERKIHVVARAVAARHGVNVICLEEGYIRPGYITVETGGNNANSPLAGVIPSERWKPVDKQSAHFDGPRLMGVYAAVYYGLRSLFSVGKQKECFHRSFSLLPECFYWIRNITRRIIRSFSDDTTIARLINEHKKNYFIVPLQVPADSQMQKAAKGWNSINLISAILASFSRNALNHKHIVFKIHPMELGHNNVTKLILKTAKAFNLEKRVHVVDTGALGPLVANSAGMITINSTSGLSAIYHGVPLLVVGDAIYANKALATCANGNPNFDSFWKNTFVASEAKRLSYLDWLKENALKPGDFYNLNGINVACEGVFEKIVEQSYVKTFSEVVV